MQEKRLIRHEQAHSLKEFDHYEYPCNSFDLNIIATCKPQNFTQWVKTKFRCRKKDVSGITKIVYKPFWIWYKVDLSVAETTMSQQHDSYANLWMKSLRVSFKQKLLIVLISCGTCKCTLYCTVQGGNFRTGRSHSLDKWKLHLY